MSSIVSPSRAVLALALSACLSPAFAAEAGTTADLDQVVVTATRTAQTQDQTLAPVTVIEREEIERRQVNSLPELLRGEAGITLSNNGGPGKATSLFMRGTESDHVLVMVDGVRIGSATSGGAALQDIPVDQIERVEIVRGPFSSLYGSEAIGGVIQVFTRRPAGVFSPTLMVSAGAHGSYRGSAGIAGRSQEDLSQHGGWYSVNVAHEQTDGINAYTNQANAGYDPDRDGYRNDSLSLQGGWRFNQQWDADVHALRTQSRNEFDGSAFGGNLSKGVQQVVGGRVHYAPSDVLKLTASVGASQDLSDTYYQGAYLSTFNSRRALGSLQGDLDTGLGLLTLGFDWQRDEVGSSEVYDLDSRTNRGAFAQWQQSFGRQSLQASLRHDNNSQFGGKNTGSLLWGLNFNDHLRLTASYGSAFKAPTYNELYYPDYGNPNLAPETSHSAELGLRGEYEWGTWTVNAYETHVNDLVAYDSMLTDLKHPFGQPNNVDKAKIRGAELGYDTTVAGWDLRTRLTWTDPKADGNSYHGNWLARRAAQSGRFDADRRFGDFSVGGSVYAAGKSYDNLANTARLGGYALLGLRVGYEFNQDWGVQLSGDNLFNRDYQTAQWYAQPGRTWQLTLRYHPAQ